MKWWHFKLSIFFIPRIWINIVSADVSDQVCSVFGNNSNLNISVIDTDAKKTLNIIFDTTGSMWDDLDNLKFAAISIVNEFSSYPTNPIGNYVLSLFNDPFTSLFQTRNSTEFLNALENVIIEGGGDCPELAMEGIINALNVSEPNTFAYVLTDADALDYFRVNEVLNLVQEKQIIVNFLLTSNCFGAEDIQFQVYSIIAKFSGGIVFDMLRSEVKDVMISISSQLDSKYVPINAFEYPKDNVSITELKIDASFSLITIAINGINPSIEVQKGDDDGNFIDTIIEYESSSFKIISFNATENFYKIITTALSDYSLRIGGLSDVKMKFGFAQKIPNDISETAIAPKWDEGNQLSIFLNDANGFIKCLSKIIITPLVNYTNSFEAFEVNLTTRNSNIYTSDKFLLTNEVFKIFVLGYDKFGNEFLRSLSTGIGRPGSLVIPSKEPMSSREFSFPSGIIVVDPPPKSFFFDGEPASTGGASPSIAVMPDGTFPQLKPSSADLSSSQPIARRSKVRVPTGPHPYPPASELPPSTPHPHDQKYSKCD